MKKRIVRNTCLLVVFLLCGNVKHLPAQQPSEEKNIIAALTRISTQFSAAYVAGDIEKLVSFYTEDAVIFPGNSDLLRGQEAIKKYWTLPAGRIVTHHKITAVEIKIIGEFAHDYGYYEVSGSNNGEAWGPNYGKYLIVWKRGGDHTWRIHLDMWNSRPKPE